jgi:hypothetical protein
MARWLQVLMAGGGLLALAPVIAWTGLRCGRGVRGHLALGAILLGFGEALDPPPKERVESAEPGKNVRAPGEPPPPD